VKGIDAISAKHDDIGVRVPERNEKKYIVLIVRLS